MSCRIQLIAFKLLHMTRLLYNIHYCYVLYHNVMNFVCRMTSSACFVVRGGFRHVQHVRPNRGHTKKEPHNRTGKFFQHTKFLFLKYECRKSFSLMTFWMTSLLGKLEKSMFSSYPSIFKHTNSKRNHVITKYSVNVG